MPRFCRCCSIAVLLLAFLHHAGAQTFALRQLSDSLSVLTLRTDSTADYWRIPHPTYRFCTGDIDGDGKEEALVGVVKKTRFHRETARRLFIYKNMDGRIRALWMGSRLGGILYDFRYVGGRVRSIETDKLGFYYVAEYSWRKFGLSFEQFLAQKTTREEAFHHFTK